MILMGKYNGFCNGVKSSINESNNLLKLYKTVYALGMLVHNENVIKNLEKNGIIFVDNIESVPDNSHLIIRAHGVDKDTYEKCKKKNLIVHDLTCPNVLKTHEIVKNLNKNGYFVILYGSKDHPESIGTISYCDGIIVENIDQIIVPQNKKLALLSQTTKSIEKYNEIKNYLINKYPDILTYNTICSATKKREENVIELSRKVDNLLVVGSKKSSNTKKLLDVSLCKNTILVDDIDNFNVDLRGNIGIVTGASASNDDAIKLKLKYEKNYKK